MVINKTRGAPRKSSYVNQPRAANGEWTSMEDAFAALLAETTTKPTSANAVSDSVESMLNDLVSKPSEAATVPAASAVLNWNDIQTESQMREYLRQQEARRAQQLPGKDGTIVHVVTSYDPDYGDEHETLGAFHSEDAAQKFANKKDEEYDKEVGLDDDGDQIDHGLQIEIHSAPLDGDSVNGRAHVVSSKTEDGVDVHGVYGSKNDAEEAQDDLLEENWNEYGPDLEMDDPSLDDDWHDEIDEWNKQHGTDIDPDNPGHIPDFEKYFHDKYVNGKKAPYPGIEEANDYFAENDPELAVYRHGVKLSTGSEKSITENLINKIQRAQKTLEDSINGL